MWKQTGKKYFSNDYFAIASNLPLDIATITLSREAYDLSEIISGFSRELPAVFPQKRTRSLVMMYSDAIAPITLNARVVDLIMHLCPDILFYSRLDGRMCYAHDGHDIIAFIAAKSQSYDFWDFNNTKEA
jgi:hypothetical protein